MAVQNIVENQFQLDHRVVSWATLANGDTGYPVAYGGAGARSIQIEGTFGTGGNVIIEGSNDGVNYHTLNDLAGSALATITAAGIYFIQGEVRYVRPRVSAGDGTTALTATLVVLKDQRQ